MKKRRHTRFESTDYAIRLNPEYGIFTAAHSEVGYITCALRKYLSVGGSDMGMGAEKGGNASVGIEAESSFFPCSFGVKINDFYFAILDFFNRPVETVKRIPGQEGCIL